MEVLRTVIVVPAGIFFSHLRDWRYGGRQVREGGRDRRREGGSGEVQAVKVFIRRCYQKCLLFSAAKEVKEPRLQDFIIYREVQVWLTVVHEQCKQQTMHTPYAIQQSNQSRTIVGLHYGPQERLCTSWVSKQQLQRPTGLRVVKFFLDRPYVVQIWLQDIPDVRVTLETEPAKNK